MAASRIIIATTASGSALIAARRQVQRSSMSGDTMTAVALAWNSSRSPSGGSPKSIRHGRGQARPGSHPSADIVL